MSDDDEDEEDKIPTRRKRVQRPALVRSYPHGVPMIASEKPFQRETITDTFVLVERELPRTAQEIVRRSKRNSDDPATFGDFVNLADELVRANRERDSSDEERKGQLNEILASPREITTRLKAVEDTLKAARRLLIAAVIACAGGIGTVASGLLGRHDNAIGDAVRLQQTAKDIDRLGDEIRELRAQLGRSNKGP